LRAHNILSYRAPKEVLNRKGATVSGGFEMILLGLEKANKLIVSTINLNVKL
jgi:hypothetical protein